MRNAGIKRNPENCFPGLSLHEIYLNLIEIYIEFTFLLSFFRCYNRSFTL